jgi:Tol biopolymer transport system component
MTTRAATWGLVSSVTIAGFVVLSVTPEAGPSRFGFSDRVERHMFPEVTSGPAEPTWSPDGQWIAFSMQGDLWKIPVAGGEAIALTKGPWYYFEPEWSPDGRSIAFTIDTGGNLDIGVVSADGGAVDRLTTETAVDLQPTWSRDSRAVYFVSSRNRGFDILRLELASRAVTPAVAGGGDQIQPAVSPDGRTLAYVSSVSGRLGTGGIWTRLIDATETTQPALVLYEESEYRMRPKWMPDGSAFLFGSDERGSNDIALVSARGGNAAVLTADEMGEFSAAPSPDGKSFAFVSNRSGPMTLYVAPIGGGPVSSWRAIRIASRRAMVPTGRLRGRIVGPDGKPMPGRVQLVASDGRAYAPEAGFPRVMAATETHYFHTTGEFEVIVPAGEAQIEALRGFEFQPARTSVNVRADASVDATLSWRACFRRSSSAAWAQARLAASAAAAYPLPRRSFPARSRARKCRAPR